MKVKKIQKIELFFNTVYFFFIYSFLKDCYQYHLWRHLNVALDFIFNHRLPYWGKWKALDGTPYFLSVFLYHISAPVSFSGGTQVSVCAACIWSSSLKRRWRDDQGQTFYCVTVAREPSLHRSNVKAKSFRALFSIADDLTARFS